ncbi:hypothetical protein FOA43_004120 [Brettanomyces nanus]|uniref:Factor arrest protein 11 n=1 Tax=Eeniella nana TaxID=13502 RepID=A0A875S5X4_EENNA|nr:uncharacterized protein FOA43_004120 [Brettanomyces nanus]QPG76726.1 hypothetical protein FOA43_004120 [Brettanomyces nanus]
MISENETDESQFEYSLSLSHNNDMVDPLVGVLDSEEALNESTDSNTASPPPPNMGDFQELDMLNDDFTESVIIDKNEMVETSDDQDLLSSPSSKMSFDGESEQDIDGFTNFNIILEYPRLNYQFEELGSFEEEIEDWFSSSDLKSLKSLKVLASADKRGTSSLKEIETALFDLLHAKSTPQEDKILRLVIRSSYLVMGSYGTVSSQKEIIERIVTQSGRLVEFNSTLITDLSELIKTRANELADAGNCETTLTHQLIQLWSNQLFYAMTTLHFIILTFLKGLNSDYKQKSSLIDLLDRVDLLGSVTKAIDKWRWISCESEDTEPASIINSISATNLNDGKESLHNSTDDSKSSNMSLPIIMAFKLRNVVIFLNDLILLQFGDLAQVESTKDFLAYKNNDVGDIPEDGSKSDVKITPIDYRRYREDLTTRYPTFTPPKYELSQILEVSLSNDEDMPDQCLPDLVSSLSMFSSEGSLKSKNDCLAGLFKGPSNPPDIHIATPMPSPTLTPQHTGTSGSSNTSEYERCNGDAKKKLFLTQSDYPNIYPFENDIPYSIQEATDIFYHHVEDDFHLKQFTSTFESFVKEESGFSTSDRTIESSFLYSDTDVKKDPMFTSEIRSLQRVERYYKENLPYLSSLIYVLIQIISSNVIPFHAEDKKYRQRGPRGGNGANHSESQQSYSCSRSPSNDSNKRPYLINGLTPSDKQRLEVLRMKESTLKSASTIILMLTKWFKLSHILKYEYFTALLFDNNFILQSFRLLDGNKVHAQWGKSYDFKDPESLINNRLVYCDYQVLYRLKNCNFFLKALSLSDCKNKLFETPPSEKEECESIFQFKDGAGSESMLSFILPFNAQCNISVENPNRRFCLIVNSLFKVLYSMVSHFKIQRIYKLMEVRPTDTLRFYLTLFNQSLYKPILKIIKLMSPFSGKKWRANNMDMISFVYLFYKVGLKDSWLTNFFTGSLEERLKTSYENEFALRSLLRYYNTKNYGKTLQKFGYNSDERSLLRDNKKVNDEFFQDQMENLIPDEFQNYLKIQE